jgi:hypothetical protein
MQIEADFKDLEKLIKELKSPYYVDVGLLGKHGDNNIVMIGAVHEFGRLDGSIPERSFIRMPLTEKQAEIVKELKASGKWQALAEKQDIKGLFKLVGIACEGVIQEAFDTGGFGIWEDIKEETKIAKARGGAANPSAILIDIGTLRKAITSEVGKG